MINYINNIVSYFNQNVVFFGFLRFAILIMVVMLWPLIVERIGKRSNLPLERIAYWKRKRWHIFLWLVLFELLVGENIFSKLI